MKKRIYYLALILIGLTCSEVVFQACGSSSSSGSSVGTSAIYGADQ